MANVFSDISNYLSGGSTGQGLEDYKKAADILGQTEVPDLTTLIPQLKMQVQQGLITPAQMNAAIQEASAYSQIHTNPQLDQDQLQSVNQLKQVATQGGLTDIDKAQLLDIQNQIASKNAAQQAALQQDFAQKGQGGSGAAMQARMLASQGNANSGAVAGANVAANAQARALQAMQNYGQMAQSQQAQQFNQQAQAANAQNAINAFNAQNRQQAAGINAGNQQQANVGNFTTANQIAGTNTGIANQQAMLPQQAAQANFTNALNRNTNTSNALLKTGSGLVNQGNQQAQNTAGYLKSAYDAGKTVVDNWDTIKNGAGSIWDAITSDETRKTDIKDGDEDLEAMMDKLIGKKFKYASPEDDPSGKEHLGVMSQDAEKAGLPTVDTTRGKLIIDNDSLKGAQLAALGNLHRRISALESK